MSKVCKMHYASQQIAKLGIRPLKNGRSQEYSIQGFELEEIKEVKQHG